MRKIYSPPLYQNLSITNVQIFIGFAIMKDKSLALHSPQWTVVIEDHIKIACIDHWFNNLFMLSGILFAYFHNPAAVGIHRLLPLVTAIIATCLVASSNYVLNEIQDAEFDKVQPPKKNRPMASNRTSI